VDARFVGVGGKGFVGIEVEITLHRKAELATHGAELREGDVAELGAAKTQVTESEGDVAAFVDFREEPGALGVRGEELHDGIEVERLILSIDCDALRAAIGEELIGLCFGDVDRHADIIRRRYTLERRNSIIFIVA
jgi:hypothetical protein